MTGNEILKVWLETTQKLAEEAFVGHGDSKELGLIRPPLFEANLVMSCI